MTLKELIAALLALPHDDELQNGPVYMPAPSLGESDVEVASVEIHGAGQMVFLSGDES